MMIGMMSDSHGDVDRTRRAAERLREAGVGYVLHAGDVGTGAVLDVLSAELGVQGIPVVVVQGNVDRAWGGMRTHSLGPGVHLAPGSRWQGTLGGCRVALLHGDDGRAFDFLVRSGGCQLVVSGHTHTRAHDVQDGVTLINPGALHRTAEPGAAVYDTETGRCMFLDL